MMRGVPLEVEHMRSLLQNIHEFTHRAKEDNTRHKKQLRESAFLLEDLIDEYMIFEERQPPDPGCAALSCEIVDFIKTMIIRHQIKSKFEILECQFSEIEKRCAFEIQLSPEDVIHVSIPTDDPGCAAPSCEGISPSETPVNDSPLIDPDFKQSPLSGVIKKIFGVIKKISPLEIHLASKDVIDEHMVYDMPHYDPGYAAPSCVEGKGSPLEIHLPSEDVTEVCNKWQPTDDLGCAAPSCEMEKISPLEIHVIHQDMIFKESPLSDVIIKIPTKDVIEEHMVCNKWQPPDDLECAALSTVEITICSEVVQSSAQITTTQMKYVLEAPPYMDEADIVGFEAPSAKLIDWLLKEQEERTFVCVVGMDGLGKTTLAIKVFSNKEVITHFDCCVWITVSRSYKIEELLRKLLYNISKEKGDISPSHISNMDQPSLIMEVRLRLSQKRYVVFFDDVWDTDFWVQIGFLLPDDINGSRIFITTMNMDVAVYCKRSSCVEVHEIQPLNLANSLELFNKKAFFDFGGNCPQNLKDVCLEIVKKCKGLPLTIVAIGGALSDKEKSESEWKRFSENLHSEMIQNPDVSAITQVFCFDYDNLPSFLKPCLLYLSIYPEDYEIKSRRLIQHWIAEGFIKQKSGMTLEQVAEEYLQELINTRQVQKSSVSIDGKVKGVRIYDLFLVLLREKARDFSFCKFVTDHDRSLHGIFRRLSIATTSNDLLESIESSHVRSLLFFTDGELPEYLVRTISTKYKLVKVLDFESSGLLHVPENLGDLIHLRYLSLRNTQLQSLPKSIGELQNLETLDLRQTDVNKLPNEISKLIKLRHLLGSKMSLSNLKSGIGGMEFLQTLSDVRIDDEDGIELITELGKLTQLKKLSLFDVREGQGIALCSSINEMQDLEKLYIEAKSKDAALDLSFVSCPPLLRKLRLKAKLNKLPEWILKLENLVELSMSYSLLTEDPLESLQDLPNLLLLNLAVRSYEGEILHFQDGGFQNLKELGLRYLSNVESVIIEKGALTSLKELTFMNIPNLKTVPSGIDYLENLEVLKTRFMPTEFEKSIAPLAKLIKEKN